MKIALICGSISKKSHTRVLLTYIESLLKSKGAETVFWDLSLRPLSIAIPEYHKNPLQSPDKNVRDFVTLITSVDGLVLGSPLYHGSYSGVLKNALDNLAYDAFRNKPIALVSNSSSIRNCAHPCEHLRLVVRALYGYALQTQIGTANSDYEEKGTGLLLIDEEIKKRCLLLTQELLRLAKMFTKNHPCI